MKKYAELLSSARLFRGIDTDLIPDILASLDASVRKYDAGEYIFNAGQKISSLGIMLSGKAMIIQEGFWGSRNIISTIGSGHIFGESYACSPAIPLNVSVTAASECIVMFLDVNRILYDDAGDLNALMITVTGNLLADMARKNIYFTEKLNYLGERTTRSKILAYLSAQARRNGSREFDIPFSRQELADYLFVDRSGLSKELSRLRDEGLLTFRKKHFILASTDQNR